MLDPLSPDSTLLSIENTRSCGHRPPPRDPTEPTRQCTDKGGGPLTDPEAFGTLS